MSNSDPGLMTIFAEALEQADPSARAVYLERACGSDAALRGRVEALLAAHAGAGHFLEPDAAHTPDAPTHLAPDATAAFEPEPQSPTELLTGDSHPAPSEDAAPAGSVGGPAPRTVIAGRYTLVEVIGEGGMGSVYRAEQTQPVKRLVAVKLIKSGADSKAVLARFDAERQALALMDHPNIARVYDGGTTERGQPFFVMELVLGVPLTDYCDQKRLPLRARLELFVQVCQAVQHAHQKGIIHRDLKPSNVLVTEVDGRPTPKVIDFGVAKATELKLTDLSFADTGAIVGTPAYMSPEQADPSSMDIDTRTDVYALGIMLYELLTGSPPIDSRQFKRGAILEMLRMVREVDPPRPSTRLSAAEDLPNIAANRDIESARLARSLRGELDWVVMKAIEKDRDRRYDSANGLAQDIQRYLADEVVEARPPSAGYRLKKFVRRYKGQVVAASLVLIALLAGIAGTTWGLIEAKRQEQFARDETVEKEKARAEEAKRVEERDDALGKRDAALKLESERADELKHRLGVSDLVLAFTAYRDSDLKLAAQRLEKVPPEQRSWDWRYLKQQVRGGIFTLNASHVRWVAFSPDGTRIVSAANTGSVEVKVWDARTGKLQCELKPVRQDQRGGHQIVSVAFSPDGKWIVSGGEGNSARVCDATTGEIRAELKGHTSPVLCSSYSPDGTRIVTGGANGEVKLWDAQKGAELFGLKAHAGEVSNAAFSPDGTRIITGSWNVTERGVVKTWSAEKEGKALLELKVGTREQNVASFSPDGRRIIVGGGERVTVRDALSGTVLFDIGALNRFTGLLHSAWTYGVQSASFSPDGTQIVTAAGTQWEGHVGVWDARTGALRRELKGHTTMVASAAFSPDGMQIVTGSQDGSVKVWDAQTEGGRFELGEHPRGVSCFAIHPDGKRIVTGSLDGTATLWDAKARTAQFSLKGGKGPVRGVAFNADGTRVATCGGDDGKPGHATVWDARTGEPLLELTGLKEKVKSVAFNRDGTRIATGAFVHYWENPGAREVKVWDARTGMILLDLTEARPPVGAGPFDAEVWNVAFSPDGKRLLAGRSSHLNIGRVKVWDAETGKPLVEGKGPRKAWEGCLIHFPGPGNMIVALSPDGKQLAACARNHRIAQVYDAASGKFRLELSGHQGGVTSVAFNPDGTRIATGCSDGTVRVWDARTGLPLVELSGHAGYNPEVISVAFTPDGTQIVTASHNEVLVWDAHETKEIPDEAEITYRRAFTAPNAVRYRKGYLAARVARDDFAARFYLNLLPEAERPALVLATLSKLALEYHQSEKWADALPLRIEIVDIKKATLGPDHIDTLLARRDLAQLHMASGRVGDAEEILVAVIAGMKDRAADDPIRTFTIGLLRQCLTIREKAQPDDWSTFNTQSVLGAALLGQQKYAEAEPLLLKGYEGMKAREKTIPPRANTRLPESLDRLIELYTATNKPHEVKKWRAERAKYPDVASPPREKK